ncbi:hypothetical protein ACVIIY_003847 [Bradyrhizobium sp. USDA 4515]|nr:hypothetical protein [Bradyrhizobium sp. USDA 4545]
MPRETRSGSRTGVVVPRERNEIALEPDDRDLRCLPAGGFNPAVDRPLCGNR